MPHGLGLNTDSITHNLYHLEQAISSLCALSPDLRNGLVLILHRVLLSIAVSIK